VLYSVLDARQLGFNTIVIEDGCFGIEERPGDVKRALKMMIDSGARLVKSDTIIGK
jgi:nicotinamidase/pyrazinamidase